MADVVLADTRAEGAFWAAKFGAAALAGDWDQMAELVASVTNPYAVAVALAVAWAHACRAATAGVRVSQDDLRQFLAGNATPDVHARLELAAAMGAPTADMLMATMAGSALDAALDALLEQKAGS